MPSVQLVLQKHKINAQGEAPISVRVIHNRKPSYKTTGIRLNPIHWDEEKLRVKSSYKNSVQVNTLLLNKIAETQRSVNNLSIQGDSFTSDKVFMALSQPRSGLLEYSETVFKRNRNRYSIGTLKRYEAVISKVRKYVGAKDIPLTEITATWLKEYEAYLSNVLGNGVNTIASNLKVLRTVLAEATSEGLIEPTKNPFFNKQIKIRSKRTEIVYLTDDELALLEQVELPVGSRLEQHRDLYLFACYTAGLRIGDLLTLDWSRFDGNILRVFTSKTSEPIAIHLIEKARLILSRQASFEAKNGLVFSQISKAVDLTDAPEKHKAISRVTALVDKNLRIIAKRAGITKHIHFHTSRHTFATKALRAGIALIKVSKLLGHSDIKTTMIYVKIENSDLQSAMEKFDESC